MGSIHFRPWGEFEWVLDRMAPIEWDLLGCISFEDRSTSALELISNKNALLVNQFLRITDPISELSSLADSRMKEVEEDYRRIVQHNVFISDLNLLCSNNDIVNAFLMFIDACSGNVVIDATCFPKRFFFPFVKLAIQNGRIQNLMVTYGKPLSYTTDELSEDPEPWDHIPLFGPIEFPEPTPRHSIVGVGFIPFGLSKLLKDKYSAIPVTFLFPFPPGSPNYQRSWEFLRMIESNYKFKQKDKIVRIDSSDVSDAFDHIKAITDGGTEPVIFAPYGPKPISIAMAIFSTLYNSPVYYTQPKKYNPNYSTGKGKVFAYVIKQNGIMIY
jgi:hypothetical protein